MSEHYPTLISEDGEGLDRVECNECRDDWPCTTHTIADLQQQLAAAQERQARGLGRYEKQAKTGGSGRMSDTTQDVESAEVFARQITPTVLNRETIVLYVGAKVSERDAAIRADERRRVIEECAAMVKARVQNRGAYLCTADHMANITLLELERDVRAMEATDDGGRE